MKKTIWTALAAVILLTGTAGCANLDRDSETFVVDSKERQCDGTSEGTVCYFVVMAADGRVYENRDDILNGKFNSAEFQARLKEGSTVTVTTTGWRIPILGFRPNIVSVQQPFVLEGRAL